jgi:hypothetical protein
MTVVEREIIKLVIEVVIAFVPKREEPEGGWRKVT